MRARGEGRLSRRPAVRTRVPVQEDLLQRGALDRKRHGQRSELMDTLIPDRWKDALGHLDRDPAEIVWA